MARRFPRGFRWGTATSAHQVEGCNCNNDWWSFEHLPGRIRGGDRSGRACDWWRNAEADFDRMVALHLNAHRLSVEWSRLEPEAGRGDESAVRRYRQMLRGLRERGVEPMVTLNHFTLPLWVARAGGWENPAVVEWFGGFARRCAEWFGDLVDLWVTVNEPNLVVVLGYLQGRHPPGVRNPRRALRAARHLLGAHAAAYRALHEVQPQARVGIAHHLRPMDPEREGHPLDVRVARWHGEWFNWMWLDLLHRGVAERWWSPGPLPECAGTLDFVGVNYYTRDRVRFVPWAPHTALGVHRPSRGAPTSDFGYGEIYPEGLYRVLREAWQRYGKPLYVTENGLPDAEDRWRPRFLVDHLAAVHTALSEGIPVLGYYHWSLVDNFEWTEGWRMKFGLLGLDPTSQRRWPRPSASVYAEVCAANTVPDP
ncbi:MAG: glycoside hydrolase family 1 protein [Armatimonadota bacterium]|nr:glycoside hydrolase family 1 protein [Armatimonadota bacterium]MDR7396425.1 glycoside hydrolase family 1 protein [Armatimonadota bacterium]MDR7399370.1 glycoside hydrolase family 1 protein [Armatimonadota bacterium]MDR7407203.1 glycoside hydrolase family 1 protein [Armatimonadota bacterium]MDR7531273.1 glycoside hydrolase family 1 protein [Armatimonadota bacterium]